MESGDGRALQLDVTLDRHLDTSALQADVQPTVVRLLAKGRLLQLCLPAEVRPDASVAQRSRTTGHLLLTMPLAETRGHGAGAGVLRPLGNAAAGGFSASRGGGADGKLPPAVVCAAAVAGTGRDDDLPPL